MRLDGQRVLLTGASGGIGKAIARALCARGAHVLASGRNVEALEALRGELGSGCDVLPADLADRKALADLIERSGRVDVLVANAALPATGRLRDLDRDRIDRALDVNLRAPMQLARALVPAMVERGGGHLVFISSLSGKVASGGGSVYSATKFGIRGFAFALREDLRETGVGVTTVFPGFISEAGMWAEAGLTLPRGVGLRSPAHVAQAVVRGIETGRAEIDVAPFALRIGAYVSAVAPTLVAAFNRRLGSDSVAEALAAAQRDRT